MREAPIACLALANSSHPWKQFSYQFLQTLTCFKKSKYHIKNPYKKKLVRDSINIVKFQSCELKRHVYFYYFTWLRVEDKESNRVKYPSNESKNCNKYSSLTCFCLPIPFSALPFSSWSSIMSNSDEQFDPSIKKTLCVIILTISWTSSSLSSN